MNRLGHLSLILIATLWLTPLIGADFQAGAAKVDITPAMGVSLSGSISKNGVVTSVHDPLHARALVISDGKTKLAIVVVDQCMTAREVFDNAKLQVAAATDIDVDHMLMAATHTHAAPRTVHIGREAIDDRYHERLADKIALAVIGANKHLSPATIAHASFRRGELVACRRFLCQSGSVGKNPFGESGEQVKSVAGSSSQIIEPAGPVDGEFSVLSIRHRDGTPLCVLGNFSVHYCGGYKRGAVSADYFGYFCAAIERSLSSRTSGHPDVIGIMSNGTSGDTGAFQNLQKRKFAPFEAMEFYGRMLAEQAIDAMESVEHRRDVTIQSVQREVELAVRKPDTERLAWAEQVLDGADPKSLHRWSKIYAEEAKHLAAYPEKQKVVLQALRIGQIAITAAPCEVFAETGLAIKAASPFPKTFNMELANGYGGYLPTLQQHKLGGYETWPARSSLLEVGAEAVIRSQLIEMLAELSE
ncbi:MAG: hypothetical protein HKN47_09160 [Pirellulaceae bacterium]|nr:hypothetical protein [Pirellulaceae bacterium]